MGAVERQRENLKESVKEINALKLRIKQTMFETIKVQKRLRIGGVTLKDRLLKLMEKLQAWRRGFKTPVKRPNTKNKEIKKKGELVLVRRSLNSRENKCR